MYLSLYFFKNKPTGQGEVDFVIGNMREKLQISCPKGRGVIREGDLLQKPTSKRGAY